MSARPFRGVIPPGQLGSITLGRRGEAGSIFGRVNYAHRFGTDDVQLEADADPRLGNGMYAYLNVGYSRANVLPVWRSGAELYRNLPGAWEASAGCRQLRFSGTPVTLITASVGTYVGDDWFSCARSSGRAAARAGQRAQRHHAVPRPRVAFLMCHRAGSRGARRRAR